MENPTELEVIEHQFKEIKKKNSLPTEKK